MRITIDINDDILRIAKARVAETHQPLSSIIEDALRHLLTDSAAPNHHRVSIPTTGSGGLLPGVHLDNTSSLLDRMEE